MSMTEAPGGLWLSVDDLARRWDLPVGTIRKFCTTGKAPRRVRFGKRVRFHLDDVVQWEQQQREAGRS